MNNLFGAVVYSVSRKDLLDDGQLVGVNHLASKLFKIDTAITIGVHEMLEPPLAVQGVQTYDGRLWDLLWMCFGACRRAGKVGDASQVLFQVILQDSPGVQHEKTFKAIVGPGDDAEPVLTICLPGED